MTAVHKHAQDRADRRHSAHKAALKHAAVSFWKDVTAVLDEAFRRRREQAPADTHFHLDFPNLPEGLEVTEETLGGQHGDGPSHGRDVYLISGHRDGFAFGLWLNRWIAVEGQSVQPIGSSYERESPNGLRKAWGMPWKPFAGGSAGSLRHWELAIPASVLERESNHVGELLFDLRLFDSPSIGLQPDDNRILAIIGIPKFKIKKGTETLKPKDPTGAGRPSEPQPPPRDSGSTQLPQDGHKPS